MSVLKIGDRVVTLDRCASSLLQLRSKLDKIRLGRRLVHFFTSLGMTERRRVGENNDGTRIAPECRQEPRTLQAVEELVPWEGYVLGASSCIASVQSSG